MKKKHIFRKILLVILILVVLVVGFYFARKSIVNLKAKIIANKINSIKEEQVINVVASINPSLLIRMKGGKVFETICLNDDCKNMNISFNSDNVNEVIDKFYTEANNNGYDTSNGVKLESSSYIEEYIDKKDYVEVVKITNQEEREKIAAINVKAEDNYYQKLFDALKEDSAYGKDYSCNMNDGYLECYVTDSFVSNQMAFANIDENSYSYAELLNIALTIKDQLYSVLDRFSIQHEYVERDHQEYVYLNGEKFEFAPKYYTSPGRFNPDTLYVVLYQYIKDFGPRVDVDECDSCYAYIKEYSRILPLNKVNLVDGTYKDSDLIIWNWSGN
jgi:hypothetical protein